MRLILSLLVLLFATGASGAEPPRLLIFGDSLSAGYGIDIDRSWPQLLQHRLDEQGYEHRVVNASISGETTEGGATRIDAALDEFSPELVVIELGGNDGLRGFPPARTKANLDRMVRSARESGAGVVLLGIRIPTNYGARYSEEFERSFDDVAADHDIESIDFFMQGIAMNDDLLQDDRIHPNTAAQPILLDNAWPAIKTALKKLAAER